MMEKLNSNSYAMHAIIISPYPIQTSMLVSALRRQNIKSICISPENIAAGWEPFTDALIFYHPMPYSTWIRLRGFLKDLNKKVPIILIGKIHQHIFKQNSFKSFINRVVVIDDEIRLEDIPPLIKECMEKTALTHENIYIGQGDYILDRKNRYLICRGSKIMLTKKEFFLMELLMANSGQITTREEIIEYVWDRRGFISQNTIEVYISRLRKKIDQESKNSLIYTVPCLGYQFIKR